MLRRLARSIRHLSFLAALILFPLLTLLLTALWIDSYFPTSATRRTMDSTYNRQSFRWFPGEKFVRITSSRGKIHVDHCTWIGSAGFVDQMFDFHRPPQLAFLGFSYERQAGDVFSALYITIPHWQPLLLSTVLSTLLLIHFFCHRRQKRPAQGLCPKCGYDLRAHRPGDRCPECATVIASIKNQSMKKGA